MSEPVSEPIKIKSDKRFKDGNIKKTGNELRGNPETMAMKRLDGPFLNPPIVVGPELAKSLKKSGLF